MSALRSVFVLLLSAGTLDAQAGAPIRPTAVPAGSVLVAGSDLIVDSMDFTSLVSGVQDGSRWINFSGMYVTARVTNRGDDRWASRGMVSFRLQEGRGDAAAGPMTRRAPSGGVSVTPKDKDRPAIVGLPYNARTEIPGSLEPGESKMISALIRNRNQETRLFFERDKYFTLVSMISSRGDVNDSNNESVRLGRIGTSSGGRFLVQWEPIEYRKPGVIRVNPLPRP